MAADAFYSYYRIEMKIASYHIWNPSESIYGGYYADKLIYYMETHFSNQTIDTYPKEIFVFLTGKDLFSRRYGINIDILGISCVREDGTEWWYGCIACEIGVRIIRHELSHLYGASDHDDPNNPIECVMCYYDDSLDWCEECQNIIWNNKFRFGFI